MSTQRFLENLKYCLLPFRSFFHIFFLKDTNFPWHLVSVAAIEMSGFNAFNPLKQHYCPFLFLEERILILVTAQYTSHNVLARFMKLFSKYLIL